MAQRKAKAAKAKTKAKQSQSSRSKAVGVRIPLDVLAEVDAAAAENGHTRTEEIVERLVAGACAHAQKQVPGQLDIDGHMVAADPIVEEVPYTIFIQSRDRDVLTSLACTAHGRGLTANTKIGHLKSSPDTLGIELKGKFRREK